RDPTLEEEPDFEGGNWSVPREALIAQGMTGEEAVAALQKSWRDNHQWNIELWNEQLLQNQEDQGQEDQDQDHPNPGNAPGTRSSSVDEVPDWTSRPTPSFLDVQPARHALKRLEKKEYVELWHFTARGCQESAAIDSASPEGAINFVTTNHGVVVESVEASAMASKVVKDENLTYEQWSEGRNRLLNCMEENGWSALETKELAKFFFNLDYHSLRSQPGGLRAVLRYQEKVRRDWTKALARGNAYAIGTINKELL
ncbi:hypothetical protein BJ322DRAFT_992033, partial [Thelephora terrestris]